MIRAPPRSKQGRSSAASDVDKRQAPLFIIGWGMMAYGMVDLVNTIKIHRCRKAFEKAQQGNDEADVVTIEEITDEPEEK